MSDDGFKERLSPKARRQLHGNVGATVTQCGRLVRESFRWSSSEGPALSPADRSLLKYPSALEACNATLEMSKKIDLTHQVREKNSS
jgi:hypothetical protein